MVPFALAMHPHMLIMAAPGLDTSIQTAEDVSILHPLPDKREAKLKLNNFLWQVPLASFRYSSGLSSTEDQKTLNYRFYCFN